MSEPHDFHANARNWAIDILRRERLITSEKIQEVASRAAEAQKLFFPEAEVSIDILAAELRHLFSVSAESATILEDAADHIAWYPSRRSTIHWRFWDRYVTFLERDFGMPPAVVLKLDELTSRILERLEDPQREGAWDRRGMVVGSVQSGKTANYIGLICKAIDAGYKLVIILAGLHSNLRAQTQLRVDEGVLGFDTQKERKLKKDNRWIGVGKLPGDRLVVHSLTSSAENGDFNKAMADSIGVMLGGDPVVLVVKKNSKLLNNLLKWVRHVSGKDDPVTGKSVISDVPLLLIDDEADNASINTKAKPDGDDTVTAINGRIRQILDTFKKSSYVGYTATPFANIFINPDAETEDHGQDLFPRSFIINVKPPSNYVGPGTVFGLDGDPDAGIAARDQLPIVETITDYTAAFPPKHKKDHVPAALPETLRGAIRSFILVCAARAARGQDKKHNSMLIHVTRFVDVQAHVAELVAHEIDGLKKRIAYGDGARRPTIREELRELWETEFVPTSLKMGELAGPEVSWPQVEAQLHATSSKIVVMPINGTAKDVLDYREHEETGLNVIAIGGDKLSRGLTLEGLSVSYFLRTSRMYDTLMQMGRWFGYRPNYLDLCRLFTTGTLRTWYRHIALAEAELRREFDYMVDAGLTPENYGLRVRTHPAGMIVTALNKMSHGKTLELSWAGVLSQTTQLPKDKRAALNLDVTERLLRSLGKPEEREKIRETLVWRRVPAGTIASYVEALQYPPAAARSSGEQLAKFVLKQIAKAPSELTQWTVALISHTNTSSEQIRTIADHQIGMTIRNPENQDENSFNLKKANILDPADEGTDFEERLFDPAWFESVVGKRDLRDDREWLRDQVGRPALDVAVDLTRRWQELEPPRIRRSKNGKTTRPNGRVLRVLRMQTDGLLLIYPIAPPVEAEREGTIQHTGLDPKGPPIIGIALSFPTSETAIGVEYRVNKVWGADINDDQDYED